MDNQKPTPNPTPPTENVLAQVPPVQETPFSQVYTAPHLKNPPPPKKPFVFSKILLPIMIIFILLAATSGTYLALNSKPKPQPIVSKVAPTSTPTPTPDPTANWKTYTNTKYGFSIKYPEEKLPKIEDETGSSQGRFPYAVFFSFNEELVSSTGRSEGVDLGISQDNPDTTDIVKYVGELESPMPNYEPTIVAGENAIRIPPTKDIEESTSRINNGNILPIVQIRFFHKGKPYDIQLWPKASTDYALFDQILSTFKFLDTSPTPTCTPRPACLDATPRCLIPETSDMCPKSITPSPTPGGQNITGTGCKTGGCSGEICQNQSDEPIVSSCVYKNSYACYKTAKCEKQQNGECGWTQTAELISCLSNSN